MLVGREKELHLLHDIQNDDSSHFVAVYGRRRVGKSNRLLHPALSKRISHEKDR